MSYKLVNDLLYFDNKRDLYLYLSIIIEVEIFKLIYNNIEYFNYVYIYKRLIDNIYIYNIVIKLYKYLYYYLYY